MDVQKRHHVVVSGRPDGPPMVFAHGFGCDQQMWRFVAPAFEDTHKVIRFDHIGCGHSDSGAYDEQRHGRIEGYAQDVVDLLDAMDLTHVVFVGHSVSAMIGGLAAITRPQRFARLVMVGPSPRYLNDPPDYVGGFERAEVDGLIDLMDSNLLGWASFLAPAVMGPRAGEPLTDELRASFCAGDAYITRRFARATFMADNRADLARIRVPTLVLQVRDDAIAPQVVGEYVHRHIAGSRYQVLDGVGHCPHMTQPEDTVRAIRDELARPAWTPTPT